MSPELTLGFVHERQRAIRDELEVERWLVRPTRLSRLQAVWSSAIDEATLVRAVREFLARSSVL